MSRICRRRLPAGHTHERGIMFHAANPILTEANRAFGAKRFAEAAALYRRAFDSGDVPIADQLRYGLCCLFAGDREEFLRIHRKHASHPDNSPGVRPLLKRYAALSAALGICAMLSACDRATYPYENEKKDKKKDDPEAVIVDPPIAKYAAPVIMKYAAPIMKYGAPPIAKYAAPIVVSLYGVGPTAPIYPDEQE